MTQYVHKSKGVVELHDISGMLFSRSVTIGDSDEFIKYSAYDFKDEVWKGLIKEGIARGNNPCYAYAVIRHGQPWLKKGEYIWLKEAYEQYQAGTTPRWMGRKMQLLRLILDIIIFLSHFINLDQKMMRNMKIE